VNTSKPVMVADLIAFGFGLGFSCQSLVSSIKHLPAEKSGIGSGIVNAARQIGTCVGIALLVSILNSNVISAKNEIKSDAAEFVNTSQIVDSVKSVLLGDINQSFSDSDYDAGEEQKNLQNKLETDVKDALSALVSVPRPYNNSTLSGLYDGADSLRDGVVKLTSGQNTLYTGIGSLSSGIDTLEIGSETLTDGLDTLNSSLSLVIIGAKTLTWGSKQEIGALISGIHPLNEGAQSLLSQFSSGSDSGTQTVYDGVTDVAGDLQTLSSNLLSYVSAVNGTCYLMIKSNPSSAQLLAGYQNSLIEAKAAYAASKDKSSKEQYTQQIQSYINLVALYTAGTDPSVTNEQQFETKLQNLAAQSSIQNVVSSGKQLEVGTGNLAAASQKVAFQFKDEGTYKKGVLQLADGISKLSKSTDSLNVLANTMDTSAGVLSQLQSGSSQLLDGSKKLQKGLQSVQSGIKELQSGSEQLIHADEQLRNGADKITTGVGLAGQQIEIQNAVNEIKADKDKKIAGAFDKTFFISAIILIFASVCGLFTDKKTAKEHL
jgi:X-X-X-Leu-X-X-Gly heptad repeat protein